MSNAEAKKAEETKYYWLLEAREEARTHQHNPLKGFCRRIYFERTTCRRRSGPKRGQVRKRRRHEVELLMFLPSGRCVQVKDINTPGLDALAEEVFAGVSIPPDKNPADLFLEYFRELQE